VGGLVFREFVELARVGTHPKSGAPLFRELRQVFVDGRCVMAFEILALLPIEWAVLRL
jgi:hypothetical protein